MPWLIVTIVILGTFIGVLTVVVVRSIIYPRRAAALRELYRRGNYGGAIRTARRILTKDPRNADAHYFLGLAYLGENKPELALMELKTVNEIANFTGMVSEVPFRKKIAELYTGFNQLDEALKEYLLLAKLEPTNAEHYFAAGKLFEERGKTDRAVNYYRKALELNPRHGLSHLHLGRLLYHAKRPAEARRELEEATRYAPDTFQSFYYLGKIYREAQEYSAALSALERAQKDPDAKVRALIERGSCLMEMNSFDRAIPELERALKLAEGQHETEELYARYFVSLCYEKTRQMDAAIEQWERIYKIRPRFKDVAEKLSHYQELRSDDHIKDFMTVNMEQFRELCKAVVVQMGLSVREVTDISEGCEILAVEAQNKWLSARPLPKLVRLLRTTSIIDESMVRDLYERMKSQNITRGVVVTSSTFSQLAFEFAETRPIDLLGTDHLQDLLKKASARR